MPEEKHGTGGKYCIAASLAAKTSRAAHKATLILDAARALFLEQGYDISSMDQVARKAGVSKATLYVHFENKQALLLALVEDQCRQCNEHLQILTEPLPEVQLSLDGVKQVLREVARDFTSFFLCDKGLAFHRLIMTQSGRFPEIGEVFYREGPEKLHNKIAAFLRLAQDHGFLAIRDVDLAVMQFLSLVEGDLPLRWSLSLKPPSDKEYEALIEGGLEVFFAAYSRKPEGD